MAFPTSLTNAADGVTDVLAAHINAVEAKIGIDSSATTTTHDYKLSGVTGTDKAVSKTGTETLTNKTLTSPVINTPTGDVATLTGSQSLTNKTLTSPKIITDLSDTNGNELLKVTATGSAVNELTLANAATGGVPSLAATGGDTNIYAQIKAKGDAMTKISMARQDNVTTTYKHTSVIQHGWGFITGDGTIGIEESITFGTAFSDEPVVVISSLGYLASSDPTDVANFNANFNSAAFVWAFSVKNITTTGCVVNIRTEVGFTLSATNRWGYAWVAFGEIT